MLKVMFLPQALTGTSYKINVIVLASSTPMSAKFATAVTLLGTFGGITFYAGSARSIQNLETLEVIYSAGMEEYLHNRRILPSIAEDEIPAHIIPLPDKVVGRLKSQPQIIPDILSMSKDRTLQLMYLAEGLMMAISTAQRNLRAPTRKKRPR